MKRLKEYLEKIFRTQDGTLRCGWRLAAVGATRPASSTAISFSSSTGVDLYWRTE